MDLSLSEEQTLIQETAKRFAETELSPIAAELDETKDATKLIANLGKLAELGFMGLAVSEKYGGADCGTVAFSLAVTEIAKGCASTAVTMSVTNMVAEVIQTAGTERHKTTYIPRICSGEYPAASFCLSEAAAGSDPSGMKTRAIKDGDSYILNGSKMWISSAEYAGLFVVWAITDADAPKGRGISCFLVEANTPGIIIGKPEKKMGQRASRTCSVTFEDCRVPAANMLGALNDGYRIAVGELAGGRIGIGSLALGVAEAAMEYAARYTTEREQFGQKISNFQGLQFMMADTFTDLEAARLLLMSAAYLKESGQSFGPQASMAKLFASEKANAACYTALQLMGGVGYTSEFPLERYCRDVRVTSIYEGTSEIQKIVIARDLLNRFSG